VPPRLTWAVVSKACCDAAFCRGAAGGLAAATAQAAKIAAAVAVAPVTVIARRRPSRF